MLLQLKNHYLKDLLSFSLSFFPLLEMTSYSYESSVFSAELLSISLSFRVVIEIGGPSAASSRPSLSLSLFAFFSIASTFFVLALDVCVCSSQYAACRSIDRHPRFGRKWVLWAQTGLDWLGHQYGATDIRLGRTSQ